jgi:hypothetical protein
MAFEKNAEEIKIGKNIMKKYRSLRIAIFTFFFLK